MIKSMLTKLLKLVERAVLDPKKEGKPWLREGNFDCVFKKIRYIYCWIYGDLFFVLFLETTQKGQSEIVLDRYISEKPKERANKSKEKAKRRVGRARSKKEG